MSRNFPDFLSSYVEYSRDEFCPEQFHLWTGISILAAALERRCWLTFQTFDLFPNLYIMLIAKPGIGKSSAANVGIKFLSNLEHEGRRVIFLANQSTDASFTEQMTQWSLFEVSGAKKVQSAGYFFGSEGSNSLKELKGGGTIMPALTEFYDCPDVWNKKLKSDPEPVTIVNAACNMLGCLTPSFLKKLVPKDEVDGGFASRLLYILQDKRFERSPKWSGTRRDPQMAEKLQADLQRIYELTGPFRPESDFITAFDDWFKKQDAERQMHPSERMQGFLARKHTNVLKLAMVICVSETGALNLELSHFDRACKMFSVLEESLTSVVNSTIDNRSNEGKTFMVMQAIHEAGGALPRQKLFAVLAARGLSSRDIEETLTSLLEGALVARQHDSLTKAIRYRLLADPQHYL